MRRILVGLDGSPAGEAALVWAARLALVFDAEVVTLHALKVPWSELKEQTYEWWAEERQVQLEDRWIGPRRRARCDGPGARRRG